MAETTHGSDMATGLGLLLGLIAVIASVATAGTAYVSFLGDHSDTMQILSGLALTVALVGGCLAVVAIHVYE
ncbi:hypothetical protein SAMN05216226_11748 [Halovenus aranensis]|jgi:hypothetical protein|uniref:Uncharacterized protein n=1 Tax=Halovenus aranensis TaxID=890420 RepID=A0A1G8Z2X5_9EURY|nr:hypothetical protein [Halovenus aranensis]SDK08974.1 hypothetical protein SAMN05216226_11748 [Halovenus aranensis]